MDFGTALKEERKKVKLTQQALADLMGMSRTYLSDVENNRYNPSVDFIKKVSSALTNASNDPDLKVASIFNKLMTAAAYSLPQEETISLNEKIKDIVVNHYFGETESPHHEEALEATIKTFEEVDIDFNNSDVMEVYINNLYFLKGSEYFLVHDKETYLEYISNSLKSMEELYSNIDSDSDDNLKTNLGLSIANYKYLRNKLSK